MIEPVAWTTPTLLARALGPSPGFDPDDPESYALDAVNAANAWSYRKRLEAGYDDPGDPGAPAPSYDVQMGATLYAVALWRERASTDGYPSFEDLAGFTPTGGSYAQIRKLLGIGRAAVDAPDDAAEAARARARRRLTFGWRP